MPNKAGFSAGVRGGRKSSPLAPSPLAPGLCPWHCPSVPSPPLLGKPVAGREPLPSGQLLTWGVAGPQAQPWLCPVPRILTSPLCSFSCVPPPSLGLASVLSPGCARPAPTAGPLLQLFSCLQCTPPDVGIAPPLHSNVPFAVRPQALPCPPRHQLFSLQPRPFQHASRSTGSSSTLECQLQEGRDPAPRLAPGEGGGGGMLCIKGGGALSSERAPEPQGRTASGGRWSQVWAGLTSR